MDDQGLGAGPLSEVELLAGGTQNILLRFTRSGRGYVLRHPPLNKRANSDETMRREARVLAALAGSAVPRPGLIARCDSTDVLGSAFYLMEPVDGYNPTTWQPNQLLTDPEWQRRLGFAMVEGIAALSSVDVDTPALADLGRRDGWLERQAARWRKQLDSYSSIPGYPGPALPDVAGVADWLERHRPTSWVPGLLHGDCHFANVMLRHDTPELAALVDWELTTIGDPLLDLGHLLAMWPTNQPDESPMAPLNLPGLPTEDEVVAHYADCGSRDIDDLPWYRVLACYRLGIILEGSNARACAGMATREVGDRLGRAAHALLSQAHELAAKA
jgi:aminoglycoside phosphotransferase (APT) family kinase protein